MTDRTEVRWGIIGCGAVTEVKSGPAFQLAHRSKLNAVMRRQADLAADYARRHGVPRWYDKAADLIADPDVDAVYVATPVGAHRDYALAVCAAGKPCYVEKPMARNSVECDEMIAAFNRAGVPLYVAYYRRCLDRFRKVQDLVQSGELGAITAVSIHLTTPAKSDLSRDHLPWRWDAAASGGGLFLDLGSHTLDILDFIFGPLQWVAGMASRRGTEYEVEDAVTMVFSAMGGAVRGVAKWDFMAVERVDQIEITGTVGTVRLSTFGNEPVQVAWAGGRIQEFDLPNPKHIQQPLIQSIVDELLGRGESPSTGVTAVRTSRLMDQVLDSYYNGRQDAFWLRPQTWAKLGV